MSEVAVPFFLVGTRKLVVLLIITFGLYQVYWFYMHWHRLRKTGRGAPWPIVGTALSGIFSYWLFQHMNEEADAQGVPTLLSAGVLALLYVSGSVAIGFGVPWWIGAGPTLIAVILGQSIVNGLPQVRALTQPQRNERLTKKNWAGAALFALMVLALLLPDPPPAAATANEVSLASLVDDANRGLPRTVVGGVVLDRVEATADGVHLFVHLENVSDGRAAEAPVITRVRQALLHGACTSDGLEAAMLDNRLALHYSISSTSRVRIATMTITDRAQCAAVLE